MRQWAHWGAIGSLIALILLNVGWELWWAPLREGGSWLVLKAALLLLPLPGILRARRYTYQWASMFILGFFAEGVMRGWADSGLSSTFGWAQAALCALFFTSVLAFVRAGRATA